MYIKNIWLYLLVFLLLCSADLFASVDNPLLVTIDRYEITAAELDKAIASSPFGTQFAAMDEKDQALLRGNMLQRLVSSRLLLLEAKRLGLDKTAAFRQEIESFRQSLLYKNYMDHLRARIEIPGDVLEDLKRQFKGNRDALEAAKAVYLSKRFKEIRLLVIRELKEKYHTRLLEENIRPDKLKDNTLLMTADGFEIRYGDILKNSDGKHVTNREWIEQQLYNRGEMLLVVLASEAEGINVDDKVEFFKQEILPSILLKQKQKEWIPNQLVLQQYYESHPEFSNTLTHWNVGQLVSSSFPQANALRNRILKGDSLFKLAGRYSVDPFGRSKNGHIGWVREGRMLPKFEKVLRELEDGQVSEIIKTADGYHLLTVLERRPGEKRSFASMTDKIQQALIAEKLSAFLQSLEKKYRVVWHIKNNGNALK